MKRALCGSRGMAQVASKSGAIAKVRKFYKDVSVVEADTVGYGVALDGRRIKTPKGVHLTVPTEMLANLVAQEWDSQEEHIHQPNMHFTSLCNTAMDNPLGEASARIEDVMEYLLTDTVMFRNLDYGPSFTVLEDEVWNPIIERFEARHGVTVPTTTGLHAPEVSDGTVAAIRKHLLAPSLPGKEAEIVTVSDGWALSGFEFVITTAKSMVIACDLIDGNITPEEATKAARLETVFQTMRFGEVEWAHNLEEHDTAERLAAAALFARQCMYKEVK